MSLLRGFGILDSISRGNPGMVLIKPTSIAKTGASSSASIGANGQVTFSACETLSLNGVFTATYDNYVITMRHLLSSSDYEIRFYMRAAGSDATGANYTYQKIFADSTSVNGVRGSFGWFGYASATQRSGDTFHIYGPYLAQPTATRSMNVAGRSSAALQDAASTHSLSTSYDGITLYPATGSISGALQVYGVRG